MKYVTIKKVKIAYKTIGRGKAILILHGFSLDHRVMKTCLEPIFGKLSKRNEKFRRIYIDLPGMGKSQSGKKVTSADKMLEILLKFIKRMFGKKKFLVIGYSYGAYLIRGILHHLNEQIDGMVMFCPVVIADQKRRTLPKRSVAEKNSVLARQVKRHGDEKEIAVFNTLVIQNKQIWKRCKQEILSSMRLCDPFTIKAMEKKYSYTFEKELNDSCSKPVLVIVGKGDGIVGYEDAQKLMKRYSNGSFVILNKAGHNLQIEQPRMFSTLIVDWQRKF